VNARVLVLGWLLALSLASVARAQTTQTAREPEPDPRPAPQRISGAVTLEPPLDTRLIAPPFLRERRGDVRTTALFPFYFERKTNEQLERFVLPYYYKRSAKLDVDVPLGLMYWLRGPDQNTFVLPPFYTHRKGKDWAFGLPPLFATGIFDGHHHTVIPPLLTWIDGDAKTRHTLVGPYFDWKTERSRFRGVFPFYWDKADDIDRFTLVPPFFFHFADDEPKRVTTVVPPVYRKVVDDTTSWGVVPFLFRKESPKLRATTVPLALFHHATGPKEFRLVTPLLSYLENEQDGRSWFTPIYQRRRGDRSFDSVMPFFFHGWDDRDASFSLHLPPFYFHWEDPANDTTVVLPFWGRWFKEGISDTWVVPLVGRYKSFERDEQTWWFAPTFQYGWTENSWTFNIHPLLYIKQAKAKRHFALAPLYFDFENRENQTKRLVLFPLYWDFENTGKQKHARVAFPLYWDFENGRKQTRRISLFPLYWDFQDDLQKKRTSIAFPLFFRFERGDTARSVSLNTYFERKKDGAGERFQFHFFPLFAFGRGERDRWWNVLYGLAGYDRRGSHRRIQAFYIPINLD
jgi:hypothetical protein